MADAGRVAIERTPAMIVGRLTGEIDLANIATVEQALDRLEGHEEAAVVVDLSAVGFMDSAVLRALFMLASRLRTRGRELHLIAAPDSLARRLLDLVDASGIAAVHDRLEDIPLPGVTPA